MRVRRIHPKRLGPAGVRRKSRRVGAERLKAEMSVEMESRTDQEVRISSALSLFLSPARSPWACLSRKMVGLCVVVVVGGGGKLFDWWAITHFEELLYMYEGYTKKHIM